MCLTFGHSLTHHGFCSRPNFTFSLTLWKISDDLVQQFCSQLKSLSVSMLCFACAVSSPIIKHLVGILLASLETWTASNISLVVDTGVLARTWYALALGWLTTLRTSQFSGVLAGQSHLNWNQVSLCIPFDLCLLRHKFSGSVKCVAKGRITKPWDQTIGSGATNLPYLSDSLWHICQHVISKAHDVCKPGSWVVYATSEVNFTQYIFVHALTHYIYRTRFNLAVLHKFCGLHLTSKLSRLLSRASSL